MCLSFIEQDIATDFNDKAFLDCLFMEFELCVSGHFLFSFLLFSNEQLDLVKCNTIWHMHPTAVDR